MIPTQSLGLVAGEPVIIAKRLEQGAGAGEIIIGKTTYPLVEHAVSAGPLERIPVKGKERGRRASPHRRGRPRRAQRRAPPRPAPRRTRRGAGAAPARVRARGRRPELPPLHRPRAAGNRQVASGRGARNRRSTTAPQRRSGAACPTARGSRSGRSRRSCARSGTSAKPSGTTAPPCVSCSPG